MNPDPARLMDLRTARRIILREHACGGTPHRFLLAAMRVILESHRR